MPTIPPGNEILSPLLAGLLTLLGTMVGLITSHILKNTGRINVYVTSTLIEGLKADGFGGEENVKIISDASHVRFRIGLDVFNEAETPKNLREISVELINKMAKSKRSLIAYVPKKAGSSVQPIYDFPLTEFKILNLPSKEILHLPLSIWLKKEDIYLLDGEVSLYIKGLFPNGKIFLKKLITEKFSY